MSINYEKKMHYHITTNLDNISHPGASTTDAKKFIEERLTDAKKQTQLHIHINQPSIKPTFGYKEQRPLWKLDIPWLHTTSGAYHPSDTSHTCRVNAGDIIRDLCNHMHCNNSIIVSLLSEDDSLLHIQLRRNKTTNLIDITPLTQEQLNTLTSKAETHITFMCESDDICQSDEIIYIDVEPGGYTSRTDKDRLHSIMDRRIMPYINIIAVDIDTLLFRDLYHGLRKENSPTLPLLINHDLIKELSSVIVKALNNSGLSDAQISALLHTLQHGSKELKQQAQRELQSRVVFIPFSCQRYIAASSKADSTALEHVIPMLPEPLQALIPSSYTLAAMHAPDLEKWLSDLSDLILKAPKVVTHQLSLTIFHSKTEQEKTLDTFADAAAIKGLEVNTVRIMPAGTLDTQTLQKAIRSKPSLKRSASITTGLHLFNPQARAGAGAAPGADSPALGDPCSEADAALMSVISQPSFILTRY